jgi:hypothetical protein
MKILIVSVISMLVCAFGRQSLTQGSAPYPVQLSIANPYVTNEYDLVLRARIISKWRKPIAVPASFTWGILRYSNNGFLLVEIQKEISGIFKEVSGDEKIDYFPDESVDSLSQGDSITTNAFSIAGIFKSNKGSYRVRTLCRFSKLNPGIRDFYSNWVYFKCVRDVRRTIDSLKISRDTLHLALPGSGKG